MFKQRSIIIMVFQKINLVSVKMGKAKRPVLNLGQLWEWEDKYPRDIMKEK